MNVVVTKLVLVTVFGVTVVTRVMVEGGSVENDVSVEAERVVVWSTTLPGSVTTSVTVEAPRVDMDVVVRPGAVMVSVVVTVLPGTVVVQG